MTKRRRTPELIELDHETDTYRVLAPERFAHILDASLKPPQTISGSLAVDLDGEEGAG